MNVGRDGSEGVVGRPKELVVPKGLVGTASDFVDFVPVGIADVEFSGIDANNRACKSGHYNLNARAGS